MLTATAAADARTGRLTRAADRPVASDSVAFFRIAYGLVGVLVAVRLLAHGWVDRLYLAPEEHLTFARFGWVEPLPGLLMYAHVALLGLLGAAIAVGLRSRLCTVLFVVALGYLELIEATLYLNHYWFLLLAGVLIAVLPVHGRFSIDVARGRRRSEPTVPALVVWAFRAQLAVVYGFAGLAKLNPDWLFDAQPLSLWFADRADVAVVGGVLALPATAYVASWAAAAFDLTVVAGLLHRRTRPFAYGAVLAFHGATGLLFQIGVFPVVMILGTLVFFAPDWPRRWGAAAPARSASEPVAEVGSAVRVGLLAFAVLQVVLPLRHYAEPGNVRWNEDGYYLAWRVMLTEKAGFGTFVVTDPETDRSWIVEPDAVLEDWQVAAAMVRPDLVHATALLIEARQVDALGRDVEVRADVVVAMNGRPARPLIDPTVDLTSVPRGSGVDAFVLPDG
ncbi:MAG: HTTM domain-containing protein [Actinomycetota bacterium]